MSALCAFPEVILAARQSEGEGTALPNNCFAKSPPCPLSVHRGGVIYVSVSCKKGPGIFSPAFGGPHGISECQEGISLELLCILGSVLLNKIIYL